MNIEKLKEVIKEFKKAELDALKEIDDQLEQARQCIRRARSISEQYGVPFGVNFESGYVHIPRNFGKLMTAVNDFVAR